MSAKNNQPKINWTPEDRARHKAIRQRFQRYRPGPDELWEPVAGEPLSHGAYLDIIKDRKSVV